MKFSYLIFLLFSLCLFQCVVTNTASNEDIEELDKNFDAESVEEDTEAADSDESDELEPPKVKEKIPYKVPVPSAEGPGSVFLAEPFVDTNVLKQSWIVSEAKKDGVEAALSKYDGKWTIEEPENNLMEGDFHLILKSRAKHHAVSTALKHKFEFIERPLVMQYEVKFQNGMECGGAYVKLLAAGDGALDLNQFTDKTPYIIMFGPDKCGNDHKIHFIFRHKNPQTGEYEEKHAKKASKKFDTIFTDKKTHLFTLVVSSDNKFQIYVDQKLMNSGSLLTDMEPPVNPPNEIEDPNDKKPEDWDDREKIVDASAVKPDDWDESEPKEIPDPNKTEPPSDWLTDEPTMVPDSTAVIPTDWDEDMDGEWEAPKIENPKCKSISGCGEWIQPKIANPKYKGIWKPPMITNADYKGKWSPRKISNPNYFEDNEPFKMTSIEALGLELWSMTDGIAFDNFIITDSKKIADEYASDSWILKQQQELASSKGLIQSLLDVTNERPWLWAVLLVVVVLPIVLIIVYCCINGGDSDPQLSQRKKTDSVSPDDEVIDEAEEEGEEEENGEQIIDESVSSSAMSESISKPATKRSDLTEPIPNETMLSTSTSSVNESEQSENQVSGSEVSPGGTKTRRRPRKD